VTVAEATNGGFVVRAADGTGQPRLGGARRHRDHDEAQLSATAIP
jgi:hypothetical protein